MAQYADDELISFLEDIENIGLDVTDWEAGFIASILDKRPPRLTEKQRHVIEGETGLMAKYMPF